MLQEYQKLMFFKPPNFISLAKTVNSSHFLFLIGVGNHTVGIFCTSNCCYKRLSMKKIKMKSFMLSTRSTNIQRCIQQSLFRYYFLLVTYQFHFSCKVSVVKKLLNYG